MEYFLANILGHQLRGYLFTQTKRDWDPRSDYKKRNQRQPFSFLRFGICVSQNTENMSMKYFQGPTYAKQWH